MSEQTEILESWRGRNLANDLISHHLRQLSRRLDALESPAPSVPASAPGQPIAPPPPAQPAPGAVQSPREMAGGIVRVAQSLRDWIAYVKDERVQRALVGAGYKGAELPIDIKTAAETLEWCASVWADGSDKTPFWAHHAMADALRHTPCHRGADTCRASLDLCVTEYCAGCYARSWWDSQHEHLGTSGANEGPTQSGDARPESTAANQPEHPTPPVAAGSSSPLGPSLSSEASSYKEIPSSGKTDQSKSQINLAEAGCVAWPIDVMDGAAWNILDATGCRIAVCGYDEDLKGPNRKGAAIARAIVGMIVKLTAERDALAARVEQIRTALLDRAQSAYSAGLRMASTDPATKGWEAKVKAGSFGRAEMDAHERLNELMGAHKALTTCVHELFPYPPTPPPAPEQPAPLEVGRAYPASVDTGAVK